MKVHRLVTLLVVLTFIGSFLVQPTSAHAQIAGPCAWWDPDLYTGGPLSITDNGSSFSFKGTVITDRKPTGSVRGELKHIFNFWADPVIRSGTAGWRAISTINAPWDNTQKYELSYEGTVSKNSGSLRGNSEARVRVVFTWQSDSNTQQDQTCAAEVGL